MDSTRNTDDNVNEIDDFLETADIICKYIDIGTCGAELSNCSESHQYCVLHINIHSIPAKFDQLKGLIINLNSNNVTVHMILLCETFLSDNISGMYKIAGYDMICSNRDIGKRGGIAMYVLKELSYTQRNDLSVNVVQEFESLFIEINDNGSKTIVGEIYRVPNTNINKSLERFDDIVTKLKHFKGNVIVGTDQNFDLLKYNENNNIRLLLNNFIENGFLPTITLPTRVTHSSATVIDNIYVKGRVSYNSCSFVIETDISDHFPVLSFVGKPDTKHSCHTPITIQYRKITNETYIQMNNYLSNVDFSSLHSGSINDAYSLFSNELVSCLNEYAPVKNKTVSQKYLKQEPWMTKGLFVSTKTKAKLFRKCKGRAKDEPVYMRYYKYNKILNKVKRKAKTLHLHQLLKSNLNNAKLTWKTINSLLGKSNDKSCVTMLSINGEQITDPKQINEYFVNHFANVGKTQSEKIPTSKKKSEDYMINSIVSDSAYFSPTDTFEVCDIIHKMKQSNSKGFDEISSTVLKNIMHSIVSPLSELINRSLSEGQFPDLLKIAKVVPLHKSNSKQEVSNYRPISVLSCISKVYEKIIHKRLYKYLELNNILDPLQFGFKPKNSTIHAITKLTQDILIGLENKDTTLAVFCDLSKAFDTLDHSILLNKLYKYGVRGITLNLFESYLNNRSMYVANNNESSTIHIIPNYGVPQGSVLGPLLFNIYVNDLCLCLKHANHILYADDTTLYIIGRNRKLLFHQMTDDLNNLSMWFRANKLALNTDKTNYIVFSDKHTDTPDLELSIDNKLLKQVTTTKFLGIHMDNYLSWETHVNHISKKLTTGLYVLNSLKHSLPSCNLRMIYSCIMHCHIIYGCILWGNCYKKFLNRIAVAQKKALRIICHKGYNAPSSPLFKAMNILKIEDLYRLQVCQFMYKTNHMFVPTPLINMYNRRNETHQYTTRHCNDFSIPNYKSEKLRRSFTVTGPKLWFNLCENMKQYNYKQFSKVLKATLIASY